MLRKLYRIILSLVVVFACTIAVHAQEEDAPLNETSPAFYMRWSAPYPLPQFDIRSLDETLPTAIGGTETGELDAETPFLVYAFEATEGMLLKVDVTYTGMSGSTYLETDSEVVRGYALDQDETHGLMLHRIPENETYLLVIARHDYLIGEPVGSAGQFEFTIGTLDVPTLTSGEAINVALTEEMPTAYYMVNVTPGNRLEFLLDPANFEPQSFKPFVELTAIEGQRWGHDENDSAQIFEADGQVGAYWMAEGGYFLISVTSETGNTADFTLQANEIEGTQMVVDVPVQQTITALEHENQTFTFWYIGTAGERIHLEFQTENTIDQIYYMDVYSDNRYGTIGEQPGSSGTFELPDDGAYRILVFVRESNYDEPGSELRDYTVSGTLTVE